MPSAQIAITDGQIASSEDSPQASRIVTNWIVDPLGFNRPRPGITNVTFNTAANNKTSGLSQNVIGLFVWSNPVDRDDYLVFVRADRYILATNLRTLTTLTLSTSATVTQLDGSTRAIFTSDSLRIIIAGGGALQTWDGVAATTTRLATYTFSVNQPPITANFVVKLANYIIANNAFPGQVNQFFWSAIGDGSDATWPALNFNTADASPDSVVTIATNLRELYILGTDTVQVYGITSDANLPFQSASTIQLGTISPYSVIALDQQFALFDARRRFVTTDGRSYQVLSDPIAKTLRDLGTVTDCFGFRCQIGWSNFLIWIFPTAAIAFCYDEGTQKWDQWRGWNGIDDFAGIRIGAYVFDQVRNRHLIGDTLYGNIFTLEQSARTDLTPSMAPGPIVCERITGRIDQGTSARKRCNWVRLYMRRGGAASALAPTVAPNVDAIEICKRDDDGPWSTWATLSIGIAAQDSTGWREWRPGGIYRRRQYRIRYSGSADTVLSGIEEDFTVMTS